MSLDLGYGHSCRDKAVAFLTICLDADSNSHVHINNYTLILILTRLHVPNDTRIHLLFLSFSLIPPDSETYPLQPKNIGETNNDNHRHLDEYAMKTSSGKYSLIYSSYSKTT